MCVGASWSLDEGQFEKGPRGPRGPDRTGPKMNKARRKMAMSIGIEMEPNIVFTASLGLSGEDNPSETV